MNTDERDDIPCLGICTVQAIVAALVVFIGAIAFFTFCLYIAKLFF